MQKLLEVQSLYSMAIDSHKLMDYLGNLASVINAHENRLNHIHQKIETTDNTVQTLCLKFSQMHDSTLPRLQHILDEIREYTEHETSTLNRRITEESQYFKRQTEQMKKVIQQGSHVQQLKEIINLALKNNQHSMKAKFEEQEAALAESNSKFSREFEKFLNRYDEQRAEVLQLLFKTKFSGSARRSSSGPENNQNFNQEAIQFSPAFTRFMQSTEDRTSRRVENKNLPQNPGSNHPDENQQSTTTKHTGHRTSKKRTTKTSSAPEMSSNLLVAMVTSRMSTIEEKLQHVQEELKANAKNKQVVLYPSTNYNSSQNINNNNSSVSFQNKKVSLLGLGGVMQPSEIKDLYRRYEEVRDKIEVSLEKSLLVEELVRSLKKHMQEFSTRIEKKNKEVLELVPRRAQESNQVKAIVCAEVRKMMKDITPKIETKAQQSWCTKEQERVGIKLAEIHGILSEKCDKEEIKKALVFLENKIKEVILVISEQEREDKEGLIVTKTLGKCLSCERQLLDKNSQNTNSKGQAPQQEYSNWNVMPSKLLIPEKMGKYAMGITNTWRRKLRNSSKNSREITEREISYD